MTLLRKSQNWFPSIFNDFFDTDWMEDEKVSVPAINVKEAKDSYTIDIAAPGATKKDFNVSIDKEDNLVIAMEKKEEKKEENKDTHYLRREFSYSKFQHTMILPDNVNKEKIGAKVEDGILKINLPKLAAGDIKETSHSIEIQ